MSVAKQTCPAGRPSRGRSNGTVAGNGDGGPAGVSSGRSNAGNEPGVGVHLQWGALKDPDGLTHARRTKLIGTAETAAAFQLELALPSAGASSERPRAAEKDRGHRGDRWRSPLVTRKQTTPTTKVSANPENDAVSRSEPPGTDPYAGWCGGRELITPGYPIRHFYWFSSDSRLPE